MGGGGRRHSPGLSPPRGGPFGGVRKKNFPPRGGENHPPLGALEYPINMTADGATCWITIENDAMRSAICFCHFAHDFERPILRAIIGQNNFQWSVCLRKRGFDSLANKRFLIEASDSEG